MEDKSADQEEKPIAVYGAMGANVAVALAKFIAALFTGSSAMLSEGIHSVADTGNQALLLFGIKRSHKAPDTSHPFGHGKELYFWTLLVAVLLFGISGGMSIYEGISHLLHPSELTDPTWNYVVLGIALIAEGISWIIAMREFLGTVENKDFLSALRTSKDPTVVTVLAEDSAALIGLLLAFLGIYFGHRFNSHYPDGIASILIGLMLAGVAFFLTVKSRNLLVGETADLTVVDHIQELAGTDPAVEQAARPMTMHLGPHEVLLNLDLQFRPDLSVAEVTAAIERLEERIRQAHPDIKRIFIEAKLFQRGVEQAP